MAQQDTDTEFETTAYAPLFIPPPDISSYQLVRNGPRGGLIQDQLAAVAYVRAHHIVYDGARWMRFDGRIYSEIRETEVDNIIYTAYQTFDFAVKRTLLGDIKSQLRAQLVPSSVRFPDSMDDEAQRYSTDGPNETEDCRNMVFSNGVLNIYRGKPTLLPFTPYIYKTMMIDACFTNDWNRTEVLFAQNAFSRIIPDPETQIFFFEMVGYILFNTSFNPPQIFLIYGPGNTGKSALHSMIATAIGRRNISELGIEQVTDKFAIATLEGKILNISGETGGQSRKTTGINGETLKRLTDGGEVTVERKNVQPYPMVNTAKFLFISNTIPDFGDSSSGMIRRVLAPIPCRERQDPAFDLYSPLMTAGAGQWLVWNAWRQYNDWLKHGRKFSISDVMQDENIQIQTSDSFLGFFYEIYGFTDPNVLRVCLVRDPDRSIASTLYEEYRGYLTSVGQLALGKKKFYEKVRNEFNLTFQKGNTFVGVSHTTFNRFVLPDGEKPSDTILRRINGCKQPYTDEEYDIISEYLKEKYDCSDLSLIQYMLVYDAVGSVCRVLYKDYHRYITSNYLKPVNENIFKDAVCDRLDVRITEKRVSLADGTRSTEDVFVLPPDEQDI